MGEVENLRCMSCGACKWLRYLHVPGKDYVVSLGRVNGQTGTLPSENR